MVQLRAGEQEPASARKIHVKHISVSTMQTSLRSAPRVLPLVLYLFRTHQNETHTSASPERDSGPFCSTEFTVALDQFSICKSRNTKCCSLLASQSHIAHKSSQAIHHTLHLSGLYNIVQTCSSLQLNHVHFKIRCLQWSFLEDYVK